MAPFLCHHFGGSYWNCSLYWKLLCKSANNVYLYSRHRLDMQTASAGKSASHREGVAFTFLHTPFVWWSSNYPLYPRMRWWFYYALSRLLESRSERQNIWNYTPRRGQTHFYMKFNKTESRNLTHLNVTVRLEPKSWTVHFVHMFLIQSSEMVTFRKELYKRSSLDHFHAYAEHTERHTLKSLYYPPI